MSQSLIGGGGEVSCKVYRDTSKICVIRSEFSPIALKTFKSRWKKKTVLRDITHSRVTFNSLENLVPAKVSVQRRTESHKKQNKTTQQNGTEMETI